MSTEKKDQIGDCYFEFDPNTGDGKWMIFDGQSYISAKAVMQERKTLREEIKRQRCMMSDLTGGYC